MRLTYLQCWPCSTQHIPIWIEFSYALGRAREEPMSMSDQIDIGFASTAWRRVAELAAQHGDYGDLDLSGAQMSWQFRSKPFSGDALPEAD